MEDSRLKAIIEGLLFASGDEGLTIRVLARLLETTSIHIQHIIDTLMLEYEQSNRGITLMQANNMFYLTTKPEHSVYMKRLLETPHHTKLSQAALETLAIIAYEQPITRLEIEEIRGVNSDRPVQTLLARSLIDEVGRKEAIGRPVLFGTSLDFLTFFGLVSLEELPPLPKTVDTSDVEQEADLYFEQFNQIETDDTTRK